MIKLENTGNGYTLSGSREELLSLTTQKLEEMFRLADEIEAAKDAEEKQKNSPYLKLLVSPKQTALKPWLN